MEVISLNMRAPALYSAPLQLIIDSRWIGIFDIVLLPGEQKYAEEYFTLPFSRHLASFPFGFAQGRLRGEWKSAVILSSRLIIVFRREQKSVPISAIRGKTFSRKSTP